MPKTISTEIFDSAYSGLANYKTVDFSVGFPAQNVSPTAVVSVTASVSLDNSEALSSVQLNYTGLETFWRLCSGVAGGYFSGDTFFTQSLSYFIGQTLYVVTYVGSNTGGVVAVPAFTVTCRGFLYDPPFTQSSGTKATGVIRVENRDFTIPVTINAGKIFTASYVSFITLADVTIPGFTGSGLSPTPGVANVQTEAVTFGTIGNIADNTYLQISGVESETPSPNDWRAYAVGNFTGGS